MVVIEKRMIPNNRKVVLFVPGYIDTFHHDKQMNEHGLFDGFDVLVLHFGEDYMPESLIQKYLGLQRKSHTTSSFFEYFAELDEILVHTRETYDTICLYGHSTGGTIAAAYMMSGKERACVTNVVLNDPFVDWQESRMTEFFLEHPYLYLKALRMDLANLLDDEKSVFYYDNGAVFLEPSPYKGSLIEENEQRGWYDKETLELMKTFMDPSDPSYFGWFVASSECHKHIWKHACNFKAPVLILVASGDRSIVDGAEIKEWSRLIKNAEVVDCANCSHDCFFPLNKEDITSTISRVNEFLLA